MKLKLGLLTSLLLMSAAAWAGFQGVNGSTSLGVFNKLTCSTGLSCTKVGDAFSVVSSPTISTGSLTIGAAAGTSATLLMNANAAAANADKWELATDTSTDSFIMYNKTSGSYVAKATLTTAGNMTIAGTETASGGVVQSPTAPMTIWHAWSPGAVANATSVTGLTTVVYMTQIYVPSNTTLTGAAVLNAATVGTNKWILALFDDSGTALANTATAGTLTAGASVFQKINFTGTYAAKGPRTYWVGLYVNGTTDTYYSIPTIGQLAGLAGSVAAQTFGTVANVTLPSTFTAGVAPVIYLY